MTQRRQIEPFTPICISIWRTNNQPNSIMAPIKASVDTTENIVP